MKEEMPTQLREKIKPLLTEKALLVGLPHQTYKDIKRISEIEREVKSIVDSFVSKKQLT